MSGLDDAIVTPLENVVMQLPGGSSPPVRFMYGAGLGGAVVFGVKPDLMFETDGTPRPWALLEPSNAQATLFPWYLGVALPAVLLGMFI